MAFSHGILGSSPSALTKLIQLLKRTNESFSLSLKNPACTHYAHGRAELTALVGLIAGISVGIAISRAVGAAGEGQRLHSDRADGCGSHLGVGADPVADGG